MSGATQADVYRLIGYIEADLRGAQAKFTEVRSMLAAGAMAKKPENELACPECRLVFHGERALAGHRYTLHDVGALCVDCGEVAGEDHVCSITPEPTTGGAEDA